MIDYQLRVGYAPTNRSQCKGCGNLIDKGDLKISYIVLVLNKCPNNKYYHEQCFKKLPKTIQDYSVQDIQNFEYLKKLDKIKIERRFEELKANLLEKGLYKKKYKEEYQKLDDENQQNAQELDQFQQDFKPGGYNDAEWRVFRQQQNALKDNNEQELKKMLMHNSQDSEGNKLRLIEQIAECIALGVIPKCPMCKEGTPQFDNWTGKYHCKGFDDLGSCNQFFEKHDIQRLAWKYV